MTNIIALAEKIYTTNQKLISAREAAAISRRQLEHEEERVLRLSQELNMFVEEIMGKEAEPKVAFDHQTERITSIQGKSHVQMQN